MPLVGRRSAGYTRDVSGTGESDGGARVVITSRADQGVAVLTMSRPARKNAFDHRMWRELEQALGALLADDGVRAVVWTGAGEDFTAGADIALLDDPGDAERSASGHPFSGVMDLLTGPFDKPIVAAVDGVAVGFGLTALLHCDIVHVSTRARLRAPFVRLGVVPEAGASFLLAAVIGIRRAAELLFTADWIDGPRAVELGIAHRCVPPADLLASAVAAAERIAAHPAPAVRATKRLLLETRRDQVRAALDRESAAFAELLGTPENLEAIRAFYEKRKPDFSRTPGR